MFKAILVTGIVAVVSVLVALPRLDGDDRATLARFQKTVRDVGLNTEAVGVTVMTFNIRLDMLEQDPNNHYTKRVGRLASFLSETRPWLVGLQEPFSGQLLHLQSLLPKQYRAIGFEQQGDRADPHRVNDYQTAILYDDSKLDVVLKDHLWLSDRPRLAGSRSWGSVGIRTATVAAFKIRSGLVSSPRAADVILVNTHLDVWSETARTRQAEIVLDTAREWMARYPDAVCFITGDFNAANGQAPYRVLTNTSTAGPAFSDAWSVCAKNRSGCDQNPFAATFHGWLGTAVDRYGARVVQFVLQGLHGGGVELPKSIPSLASSREVLSFAWRILQTVTINSFLRGLPDSVSHMHVDWLLYSAPGRISAVPRGVYIAETRDHDFSSDHFPVVGLFELRSL